MTVSLIVAVAEGGVIGREGRLPWRLSADLQRFKQRTLGHHLIMGRRTFESLGRVLPGRISIVITRDPAYRVPEGVIVAHDAESALRCAAGDDEVFVIGGAEIYRLFWERAQRLYLTRVLARVAGDTYLELHGLAGWQLRARSDYDADERNEFPHADEVWERSSPRPPADR